MTTTSHGLATTSVAGLIFLSAFVQLGRRLTAGRRAWRVQTPAGATHMRHAVDVTGPGSPSPSAPFDEATLRQIRRLARRTIRRAGLPRTDQDDLEQRMALKLHQHQDHFCASRGTWPGFVTMALNRYLRNVLRDHFAAKRHPGRCTSLHFPPEQADDRGAVPLECSIGQAEQDRRRQWSSRDPFEHADLRTDLESVYDTLAPGEKEIVDQLRFHKARQAADNLGVSPSTVHRRIRDLRRRFESAGLEKYL